MICLEGSSADAVWRQAVSSVRHVGTVQEGRDEPTKEILHVCSAIADPRQRIVFARPINAAFAVVEVIWILAGFNDVGFLHPWNPRYRRLAADEGQPAYHGAYGYRLGSHPRMRRDVAHALRHPIQREATRFDQLRAAYEALQHEPNSRQIVLQIWDGRRDMPNPAPRSRDIPCNIMSHLLVRDGRLEWLQVMRSNDLIWGFPYNFIQFTTIQEIMAGWLGIDVGTYQHVSNSLHVYQRHWNDLLGIEAVPGDVPKNAVDLRIGSYREWEGLWARLVDCVMQLAEHRTADRILAVADKYRDLPPAYAEWVDLLTAEMLRRRGHITAAKETIVRAGPFWGESWRRWAESEAARDG